MPITTDFRKWSVRLFLGSPSLDVLHKYTISNGNRLRFEHRYISTLITQNDHMLTIACALSALTSVRIIFSTKFNPVVPRNRGVCALRHICTLITFAPVVMYLDSRHLAAASRSPLSSVNYSSTISQGFLTVVI